MGAEPAGTQVAADAPVASGTGREPQPAAAATVFGARLGLAERFAELLATDGALRGVIGPREPGRIWTRHLLNCAVISELFDPGARVVDVGSGAGLPGIALAIRRADLRVDLVEPLQRRVAYLSDCVTALGLGAQVRVIWGRADDPAVLAEAGGAAWVTARAVAPLDRLVGWCLPLLAPDGRLALIRGATALDELSRHGAAVRRAGGAAARVVQLGDARFGPPVAVVTMGRAPDKHRAGRRGQ